MCGICGLFGSKGYVEAPRLRQMTESLQHRGPDAEAYYFGGEVGLGFRRLAIVDREQGHQPLQSENGHIKVIFNGEIYNHRELKKMLRGQGHRLEQGGDGEVIAHLYEEEGFMFPAKLRGTFAIALWDERRRRLMLVRDRLGVKPLYIRLSGEGQGLAFASEMRALLLGEERPAIDIQALDDYLSYRYVPAPYTIFQGIWKVEPGTALLFQIRQHRVEGHPVRYWRLPEESVHVSSSQAARQVAESLEEAWQIRWPEEVPAGYFFSGGLDSAGLVALHQASRQEPARTYAVGFEQPEKTRDYRYYSELEQARQAARVLQTRHFERIVTRTEVEAQLPRILAAMDEPIADPTALPLYFLSEFAATSGEKVVFSGEGADEVFGGYTVYWEPRAHRRFQSLPGWARSLAHSLFPEHTRRFSLSLSERYFGVGGLLRPDQKNGLYQPYVVPERSGARGHFYGYDELKVEGRLEEERMLRFDLMSWLPENTLMKSDKMSMAHSLEMRLPYLDHQLVELGVSLPLALKVERAQTKRVLREALQTYLPAELCQKPKNGFPVPITAWLNGEWRTMVEEVILDPGARLGDYLRREGLQTWLKGSLSSRSARLAWALFSLETYLQQMESAMGGGQHEKGRRDIVGTIDAGRVVHDVSAVVRGR
ncbi:MAG: asparagine synthase (glutamine-hydrolyzing) [Desulfitobacteriaceae bacterium]